MRHALMTLTLAALGAVSAFSATPAVHKVRRGDTASAIARKAGLSLQELHALNPKVNFTKLTPGTLVKVEAPKPLPVRAAAPTVPVPALPGTPSLGPNTPLAHLERMLPASPRLPVPKALNEGTAGSLAEATPALGTARMTPVLPPYPEEPADAPALYQALTFQPADPARLDLLWPVGTRTISSGWGPRMRTATVRVSNKRKKRVRYRGAHRGLDLTAPQGSDVYAAQDGVAVLVARHRQYGNYIILDHGNGVTTLYAHHRANLIREGDVVRRGQKIAEVGRTGNATGPHLHFELKVDGVHQNPMPVLNDTEEIGGDQVALNAQVGLRD